MGGTSSKELRELEHARALGVTPKNKDALTAKGISLVTLMVPSSGGKSEPRQFSFTAAGGFAEDASKRNMRPTMPWLLEIDRLAAWEPVRLPAISPNSVVLLGTQVCALPSH